LTDLLIVRALPLAGDPEALFRFHGLALHKKCEGIHNTFSIRVTDKAGKNCLKVSQDLIQRPEVVYAEPNLMERYYPSAPSDRIDWGKLWHLDQISVRQAWENTKGERDVVIAVVDDGCDLSHPAFGGPDKVVHPTDFVDGDAKPWADHPAVESGRHGTAFAGPAVAEESENGVVGVAPRCAFMPVRMTALERIELETLSVRDIFEVAGQHADILSCSWSSVPCYDPVPQPIAEVFDKIVVEGGTRGKRTVICFAAGKHNAPIRDDDNHDFKYKPHPSDSETRVAQSKILNGYAAHPNVMAVASVTSANQKARYCNWGKEISVCAPSDNFDPPSGQRLLGEELFTTDNEDHGPGYVPGQRFTGFGGTSGACPILAGVADLVRSVRPDLTALQVKAIIEETADPITTIHTDSDTDRTGERFIDGHSSWFGYGRVNAQKAVEKALLLP